MFAYLAVLLFAGAAIADVVPVEDCGSSATIASLEFDGCTSLPCEVFHGTHATGRINIQANSVTNTLTCKLAGMIGPIELPFDGCPSNACASMASGDCPTEVGENLVYELDFEILDLYPTIEVTAKWRLLDDNGADFICFKLPISIKN